MIHHQESINWDVFSFNLNLGVPASAGSCCTYNVRQGAPSALADPWTVSRVLTEPAPVQVHRHEHRGDREEVHHRVHLQPEPQLVVGSDELRQSLKVKGQGWTTG